MEACLDKEIGYLYSISAYANFFVGLLQFPSLTQSRPRSVSQTQFNMNDSLNLHVDHNMLPNSACTINLYIDQRAFSVFLV